MNKQKEESKSTWTSSFDLYEFIKQSNKRILIQTCLNLILAIILGFLIGRCL